MMKTDVIRAANNLLDALPEPEKLETKVKALGQYKMQHRDLTPVLQ